MYEKMKEELVAAIKDLIPFKVVTYKACKGGKELDAFCITQEDTCTSPAFYFKDYINEYENGMSAQDLAKKILKIYQYAIQQTLPVDVSSFQDYASQKGKIAYKLVNTNVYKDQLPLIPHIEFFDLSIIFYCVLDINEKGCMSYVITNDMLALWNVGADEIYRESFVNTPKLLPLEISCMEHVLLGISKSGDSIQSRVANLPIDDMYVVTNIYNANGFSAIFTPDLLKIFGERFGDFYILPSSTEEALFIPVSYGMDVCTLKQMVREVNETVVEPSLFLSNSVYRFNTDTEKISAYISR